MSELPCTPQGTCPYLYDCINQVCVHQQLLPPTVYTGFVYLLIPFLLSLANIGGLSGGFLKVPIMMDLLNYNEKVATYYTYPLTFGGGLANFFLLIPQRHPTQNKPLVNYELVYVLLPCVITGTTLGVICNMLVPELAMDIIIILVFTLITYLYVKKYMDYKLETKIASGELSKMLIDSTDKKPRPSSASSKGSKGSELELIRIIEVTEDQQEDIQPKNEELKKLKNDDKTMQLPCILYSLLIYVVFQLFALLMQGKLFTFKVCTTWFFGIMLTAFLALFATYMAVYYRLQKPKYAHFDQINYKYEINLAVSGNYLMICAGGLLSGFSSGLIGAGCGHIMILFMSAVGVQGRVASATSGYQVLFIGATSLIQAVAQQALTWQPLVFFSLLALIGSYLLSIIAYKIVNGMPNKGQGPILVILIFLSVINIVGVIPNLILTKLYYGWDVLLSIKGFEC